MNQLPKNSAYRSSIEFGSDGIIAKDFRGQQTQEEEHRSFAYKGSLAMTQGRMSTKLSAVNPFTVVQEETDYGLMKEDEIKDKRKAAKVRTMKEQIYMLQDRRKRVSCAFNFLDPR